MKKEFHKLEVGKEFDLFVGRDMRGLDGCIFERFKEGNEYCLIVYMYRMSSKERELLRFSKILVRVIQEGDFILTLIRFGNSELCFEISFDPVLYRDGRMDLLLEGNLIYVIGVESNDNTIQTLRMVSMPMGLLKKYVVVWESAKRMDSYNSRYERWIMDLDKRYSVMELWEMGVYVGRMGE